MIFDRFDEAFRSPVGAVAEGTKVSFSLHIPRSLGTKSAHIEVLKDGDSSPKTEKLIWTDLSGCEDV